MGVINVDLNGGHVQCALAVERSQVLQASVALDWSVVMVSVMVEIKVFLCDSL